MPRSARVALSLAARRREGRPKLQLGLDDVKPTTVARYDKMLGQLNLLISMYATSSLDELIKAQAAGAIQIWVVLLMQIHFDCGTAGLGDIGNLLSALSRFLRQAAWRTGEVVIAIDSIMKPLWKSFSHWKKVEPYEFRFPLPRQAVQAILGLCVETAQWHLLLFIMLCHHCWLRPAECLSLRWDDVCLDPYLENLGVVCISNPKIKSPATQYVLLESAAVAKVCKHMKLQFCRNAHARIFPFNQQQLHVLWLQVIRKLGLRDLLHDPRVIHTHATLGGLRSSGATLDFLRHENLDRVKWRGRWQSDAVLKHYLQMGVYHLAVLKFTTHTRQCLLHFANVFDMFVRSLPDL